MKNNKLLRAILVMSILLVGCVFALFVVPQLVMSFGQMYWDQQEKAAEPMRHILFCEKLSPGLSVDETLKIVSQFGTYTSFEQDGDPIGEKLIVITFNDKQINEQFGGGIVLVFRYGKYEKATYSKPIVGDSKEANIRFKCDQ